MRQKKQNKEEVDPAKQRKIKQWVVTQRREGTRLRNGLDSTLTMARLRKLYRISFQWTLSNTPGERENVKNMMWGIVAPYLYKKSNIKPKMPPPPSTKQDKKDLEWQRMYEGYYATRHPEKTAAEVHELLFTATDRAQEAAHMARTAAARNIKKELSADTANKVPANVMLRRCHW
jgi:hypothetical protein